MFCVHDNLIIQPLKRKLLYNIIMVWREGFIQFIHVTKSLDQSISGMRGGFPVQTFNFLAFSGLSTTWKVQTFAKGFYIKIPSLSINIGAPDKAAIQYLNNLKYRGFWDTRYISFNRFLCPQKYYDLYSEEEAAL